MSKYHRNRAIPGISRVLEQPLEKRCGPKNKTEKKRKIRMRRRGQKPFQPNSLVRWSQLISKYLKDFSVVRAPRGNPGDPADHTLTKKKSDKNAVVLVKKPRHGRPRGLGAARGASTARVNGRFGLWGGGACVVPARVSHLKWMRLCFSHMYLYVCVCVYFKW